MRRVRVNAAAAGRRLTLVVAAGASVVSVAASLPDARRYVFWADEFASAKVILKPTIGGVLGQIARRESTPPAWYLLAWVVHHTGVTPHGLRMLSVIFAAALAGLSVLYARRFMSLFGAALVGILVALGGEFMRHSWELRAYSLFALLCLVFAVTLEWASRSVSKGRLALLAVVVALGSTTHYFFLFTLFAGLVWLWLTPASTRVRRRVTGAAALGLLPLIAWSPWFVHQTAADHTRRLGAFSLSKIAYASTRLLATGAPKHHGNWLLALHVLIDVVAVVGVIVLARRGGTALLCALLALSPLVCGAVLSLAGFHILDFRNLIGSGPFLAIAVVVALDAMPMRPLARVALAAALILAVCGFVFAKARPPHRLGVSPYRAVLESPMPSRARGRIMGV